MTNRLKRPLAEKSQLRHIRFKKTSFSRKPCIPDKKLNMERYREVMFARLESAVNHASRINSYYGTLSGNHGRSFRIRHKKNRLKRLLAVD